MKKVIVAVLVMVSWCNVGFADGIKELNKKLLEIEKRLDTCLSTKDKDICNNFVLENPYMLEILGNADFAKLLTSNKCQTGTKCGATMARFTAKMFQLESLVMEMN
jgi:hypothetical protein